jgi:DNA-binding transcriptional ArsR family regulator
MAGSELAQTHPVDNITRVSIRLTPSLSEGGLRVAGTDQLSEVFSALADPTRRAILAELAERDATVTELTAPFSISMPAVSRHLKVLERAALISRSRSGKWRASHLEAAPLREAADWIERYRRFWDSSLTRLDAHLAKVQAAARATDRIADDPRELA